MGNSEKIIDLASKSAKNDALDFELGLSPLVLTSYQIFSDSLKSGFDELFSETDDHLFDKSGKSDDSRHFAALRTLRVRRVELTKAFIEQIKQGFTDALGKSRGNFNTEPSEFGFENLSLVEDDDLEERIALDSMSNKALKANKLALTNIVARLDAIAPGRLIHDENNPLSPEKVSNAFSSSLKTMDLEVEFKLVLYKFFERKVIDELEWTYDQVNQYFISQGILPDLKLVPVRPRTTPSSRPPSSSSINTDNSENRHSALANESATEDTNELLNMLGSWLSKRRYQEANGVVNQQIETTQLVNLLSQLQMTSEPVLSNQLRDIRQQIGAQLPQHIGAHVTQGALGQTNDNMIDVVTMLFDFILDDENLNSEIKASIARLQIPILKVGLSDPSFFSNRKHAARLLLNELAHAGLSWEPDDSQSAPMLDKIKHTVETICHEYKDQPDFFDYLLDDFIQFKTAFKKRAEIFEKRVKEAEEGKAKAESARSKVNRELKKICNGKRVPDVAKDIFKNVWVHVMFLENLKQDQQSWENVVKIARMLVWSLQPVKEQARLDKLMQIVPSLVKNLNLGFSKISYSHIDASRILDLLEEEHRKIIVEAKAAIEEAQKDDIIRLKPKDPFAIVTPVVAEVETETVDQGFQEIVVEEIAFSAQETGELENQNYAGLVISEESRQTVATFNAGSWFELKCDGEFKKAKLAARITSTGKFIFVNRSGVKVAEYLTEQLAAAYQTGEINILDDEALFDRALRAVISNLREMKAESESNML